MPTAIGGDGVDLAHPEGRKAVFLGDLVDRGPRHARRAAPRHGTWSRPASALCVPGNHDMKLHAEAARQGRADHPRPGRVAGAARACRDVDGSSRSRSPTFLDGLVSHYVLDDGKLVVAHAGMKEEMQGRGSGKVREFALYGETTGETDEFGLPVRYNWAAEYRGAAHGRLRPHAGARAGMAQPHDQHRHRLRLRRQADGAALPGDASSSRCRRAQTYCEPARPFLPPRRRRPRSDRAAGARRRARPRGRARQADRHDPAARQRDDPRGERHGGAGGDEPVRRQSEVADLPAAHDVAVRDEPRAGPARTPRRGVRLLPHAGRPAGRLRGEAHGLARRRDRLPRRGGGARALRRRRATGSASVYTRTGRRFFDDARSRSGASSTACAARSTRAGLWDELRDRLGLPRLRADAVVGQGAGAAAAPSTPPSARPRRAALPRRRRRAGAGRGARTSTTAEPAGPRSRDREARVDAVRRRLPPLLLAGATRSTTSSSRRSTCWPPRARSTPTSDHVWHMETLARLCARRRRSCCWRRRTASWT